MINKTMESRTSIKKLCICTEVAELECNCNSQIRYFCSNCASQHIKNPNFQHKISPISIPINESSRLALINFIKDSITNLDGIKTSISAEMHKIFLSLQEHAKIAFKDLSDLRKNLKSLLSTLSNSPQSVHEWNIKRILEQNLEDTIKDLSALNLFSVSFYTNFLEIPWVIFDSDYEMYINAKPQPKPVPKPILIAKVPSLPIERPKSCDIEKKGKMRGEIIGLTERKLEQVLYCEKNHKLIWSYTAVLESFLSSDKQILQCKYCRKDILKSCWRCSECAFYVCEKCGERHKIPCPKILCDKNHELLWKCTVAEKYRHQTGSDSWKCRLCEVQKSTPSWHCAQCSYDICKICAIKFNAFPIELKEKCLLKHSLKQEKYNGNVKCRECSNTIISNGYSCNICNYYACGNCYRYHSLDIAQYPILICSQKHLLRWNVEREFSCRACTRKMRSSFCCMICDLDLCYGCADFLEELSKKACVRADKKGHLFEKRLIKSSINHPSLCKCCKIELPGRSLVFYCGTCKYYICITCFRDDKNVLILSQF